MHPGFILTWIQDYHGEKNTPFTQFKPKSESIQSINLDILAICDNSRSISIIRDKAWH